MENPYGRSLPPPTAGSEVGGLGKAFAGPFPVVYAEAGGLLVGAAARSAVVIKVLLRLY
jgi:hypothetical protein